MGNVRWRDGRRSGGKKAAEIQIVEAEPNIWACTRDTVINITEESKKYSNNADTH